MEPKLFIATKAIVTYNDKVLILRESGSYSEGTNSGRFDVPGGRLKPGEYFDQALLREVFEETGLQVTIKKPLAVGEWRPIVCDEPWQIVGIFFVCEASSNQVVLSEDHDAYEWIDPISYPAYDIIENLKPVFEEYITR